jgi:hypothetical protein
LPGQELSLDFKQRTASVFMPSDADWHDALRIQEEQEREGNKPTAAMAPVD